MKEIYNKIRSDIYSRKIIVYIIFIIFIISLLFGSIYIVLLDNNNKKIVLDSVKEYYDSYNNIDISNKFILFKDSFSKNMLYFIIMWLLGLSIIGTPIIIIMLFFKCFTIGISISSIFACYKYKSLFKILIYLFPSNIILLILSMILSSYSSILSIRLLINALRKKSLNFASFMGKYLFILMIIIILLVLISIYDAFIMPSIYNLFLK